MSRDDLVKRADEALKDVTPGPWRVVIDDDGNPLSGRPSVSAPDELDCSIVHWDGFVQTYWRSARGDKEIHSNARFIAAARELVPAMRDRIEADAKRIAYWQQDSAAAWDKCEERRIAQEAAHARIAELEAANARLRRTVDAAAKLGRIFGFLGEDEELIEAFRQECGPELLAIARAALGETAPAPPAKRILVMEGSGAQAMAAALNAMKKGEQK